MKSVAPKKKASEEDIPKEVVIGAVGSTSARSDPLQRALELAFAPFPPATLKTIAAFELITAKGKANSRSAAGEVTIALLVNALSPRFDSEKPSLQREMLECDLGSERQRNLLNHFEQAKSARRAAIHRIVEAIIAGAPSVRPLSRDESGESNKKLGKQKKTPVRGSVPVEVLIPGHTTAADFRTREEALIGLIARFPERILPMPAFRQLADLRFLMGQGAAFVGKLNRSVRKARERGRSAGPEKVDEILLLMAQHWINPDFPLWMMREPAATKTLSVCFGLQGDIANAFRDRRRDHFEGLAQYPLLDAVVVRADSGKSIREFVRAA